MCGIAGVFNSEAGRSYQADVLRMTDAIQHRGPDDAGIFEAKHICLGHRRLSIIDLSPSGHQPMFNADATVSIVFNGEIFNYVELRENLKHKYHFSSGSDTEVILHYYEEYGVKCLDFFNGMFAFALWDSRTETLFCARDRFGKKPFYYHLSETEFVFCSEIRPILDFPTVKKEYNERALIDYLLYSLQDHSRDTFFKNIYQLEQGSYLLINKNNAKLESRFRSYYDLEKRSQHTSSSPEEFLSLLKESLRIRLRSDVPVGILLSGGLDSAAITSLVHELAENSSGIKLFTAASHEKEIDESPYAALVAKKFGFHHEVVYPDGTQLLKDLQTITRAHEKPVPGTSVFSHYHIMKQIGKYNVRVILQGQGSDELLAGYDNFYNPYLAQSLREFRLLRYAKQLRQCADREGLSVKKLILSSVNKAFFKPFTLQRRYNATLLKGAFHTQVKSYGPYKLKRISRNVFTNELYNYMKVSNLPYILQYEDRNSMMFSIESRTPFLDYKFAEHCFNLPAVSKINKGERKAILKQAMRGRLPDEIIDRQKRGFPTPTRKWLAEDSRQELSVLLNSDAFKNNPFFDAVQVQVIYKAYCAGESRYEQDLWKVLAIYTWYTIFFS